MSYSFTEKKRIRNNFGTKYEILPEPDLLKTFIKSFDEFIQKNIAGEKRLNCGLESVFNSIFPITAINNYAELEYVSYDLSEPKFTIEECKFRGITYSASLRVLLRLVLFDKNISSLKKKRKIKDIKEQSVYLGNLPVMTYTGTFVINGTERVVVSQLHRSPGVIFEHDKGKTHSSGKVLFSSRIIPYRGSWLDFEFDHNDNLFVRIDRRRKLPITALLMAMDMSHEQILDTFFETNKVKIKAKSIDLFTIIDKLQNSIAEFDIKAGKNIIVLKGRRINHKHIKLILKHNIGKFSIEHSYLLNKVIANDIVDKETGEILYPCNTTISEEILADLIAKKIKELNILSINELSSSNYISKTLAIDEIKTPTEARTNIYHVMRPGEPATIDAVNTLFNNLFFTHIRYDLSKVGRMKINSRLDTKEDENTRILTKNDILLTIKKLINIKNGNDSVDDVDTLANRRIRSIGEMLENQFRIGLIRVEKAVKERLNLAETDELTPQDLINSKPISLSIREFFGSSQLSQFMDQVNPLSGVTHKRRISALGPGGLTRDRAGFEVRDVHPSHYGRLCPVETPEGPNIGLINTLAVYATTNEYGFLETPYIVVKKGVVTNKIVYISAINELKHTIAQANASIDKNNKLTDELISCRRNNEFVLVNSNEVTLIDVSSKQIVSVAAALIPFLEHDDANRALMGSNMQRQAVPVLKAEKPLVGTGIERVVATDSRVCVTANNSGIVEQVDAGRIVIRSTNKKDGIDNLGVDIYNLIKYSRSNQNTCINQKVLVSCGDKVEANDVIADGPSIDLGELALGQNMRVAFMPWNGYNFEDSILISENVIKDNRYTSIHIEELTIYARDTKLGAEEITVDVPNVSEQSLSKLDASGIVYVSARVKGGDILVGKVTPKTESVLSPEEKLLKAIFGEKASNVKDSSLRMSAGKSGVVIDVQVFNREGVDKDDRSIAIDKARLDKISKDLNDELNIICDNIYHSIDEELKGNIVKKSLGKLAKGKKLTKATLKNFTKDLYNEIKVENASVNKKISMMLAQISVKKKESEQLFINEKAKLAESADLSPGVIKMIKVYVASRKSLQVGDKIAGRHGNKGVISRISPIEDMPYLADGSIIDVVLNPLGVPSRMNIGQVLETHLGYAVKGLGVKISQMLDAKRVEMVLEIREFLDKIYNAHGRIENIKSLNDDEVIELANNLRDGVPVATPVFNGISEANIKSLLELAELPKSGQETLYDGITGEAFDRKITVGYMYMLKLNHLVDDKMHARSTGPYSLVTQQPLSGKAQFGGQRFGEMEVWALEAYGAAYTLREMLTVKSDDVTGRAKTYKNIVDGVNIIDTLVPESFNVLMKEIKALGINIDLEQY